MVQPDCRAGCERGRPLCAARVRQVSRGTHGLQSLLTDGATAEFRGPRNRNRFVANPDDYEMDLDRSRGFSGLRSGRIIVLGDGTEVVPDQSEEELFEQAEEVQDEPSTAGQAQSESSDTTRNDREDTPGPQAKSESGSANISESPASTTANNSTSGAEKKSS